MKYKESIHTDMMKPRGEIVIFIRKDIFYTVQLSGHKPTIEECADHAERNPGTIRIESMTGEVLWPEGTKH